MELHLHQITNTLFTLLRNNTPLVYSLRDSKTGKLVRRIMDNNILLEKLKAYSLSQEIFKSKHKW